MVTNILEAVQKRLGYEPLKKVDPNTQETKDVATKKGDDKLSQAAVPAVLAAMIKYSEKKEGIQMLSGEPDIDWLTKFYNGKDAEAIGKVSEYAGVSREAAENEMKKVADEAVAITREEVKTPDAEALRTFMNSQRHNVLGHLPASMKIGDVLNDDSLDDRTHKMEGPISGFLHKIEDIL
jgi:hypothetical protein